MGMPLHWLSPEFFNQVREACGGIIEIHKNTKNFFYLYKAKIRVRANHNGLLPQSVSVSDGNSPVVVTIAPAHRQSGHPIPMVEAYPQRTVLSGP